MYWLGVMVGLPVGAIIGVICLAAHLGNLDEQARSLRPQA